MTLVYENQKKSVWEKAIFVAFILLYCAINIFKIGGDAFIISINSNLSTIIAICISILSVILLYQVGAKSKNRMLWLGFTIGWIFWSVAETWWSIAGFLGQELPYPSGADLFWLIGYLPMYFAIWERNRSIPVGTNRFQKIMIALVAILSAAVTIYFILLPILADADANSTVENLLNIAYPLADLFLLVLVLRVFFNYQNGVYGKVWLWISIGFILESVSDLVFSYASAQNLYYPNNTVNFISTIACDVPYNLSYVCVLIGLFLLWSMQKSHKPITENSIRLALTPNTHLLIFTNKEDMVEEVSANYPQIFGKEFNSSHKFWEVTNLSNAVAEILLATIKREKFCPEREYSIKTNKGDISFLISGEAIINPEGQFMGAIILLRYYSPDNGLDSLLTDYQKGIVRSILKKSGVNEDDQVKQLIFNYFMAHLNPLYNIILNEGGSIMADAYLTKIRSEVKKQNMNIVFQSEAMLDMNNLPLQDAYKVLPALFESAKSIATEITDEQTVSQTISRVHAKIDPAIIKYVTNLTTNK